jgi:hypothetical protein
MRFNNIFRIGIFFILIIFLLTACGNDGQTQLIRNKKIVDKTVEVVPDELITPEPEPVAPVSEPDVEEPEEILEEEPEPEVKEPEPEPVPDQETYQEQLQDSLSQLVIFDALNCSTRVETARTNLFTKWEDYRSSWRETLEEEWAVLIADVEVEVADDELDVIKEDGSESSIASAEDHLENEKDDLGDARRDRDQTKETESTKNKARENALKLFKDTMNACESDVQNYVQEIISKELYTPQVCHSGLFQLRMLTDLLESDYDIKDELYIEFIQAEYTAAKDELTYSEENIDKYSADKDKLFAQAFIDMAELRERKTKSEQNKAEDYLEDVKRFLDAVDVIKKKFDAECGSLERAGRVTTKTAQVCQDEIGDLKEEIEDVEKDLDDKKSDVNKYTNEINNLYGDLPKARADYIGALIDESGESSAKSEVTRIVDDIEQAERWRWQDVKDFFEFQDDLDTEEQSLVGLRDSCGK